MKLRSVLATPACGHNACKSLGEPHPFCDFVTQLEVAPVVEPLHPHNDGLDEYRQPVHVGELDPAQRLALARGELK